MKASQVKHSVSRTAEQIPQELMSRIALSTGLTRQDIAIDIEMTVEAADKEKKVVHFVSATMDGPMKGVKFIVEE